MIGEGRRWLLPCNHDWHPSAPSAWRRCSAMCPSSLPLSPRNTQTRRRRCSTCSAASSATASCRPSTPSCASRATRAASRASPDPSISALRFWSPSYASRARTPDSPPTVATSPSASARADGVCCHPRMGCGRGRVVCGSVLRTGNRVAAPPIHRRCVAPGTLVVIDLTDPLLSSAEANGVFQVRACAYYP